MIDALLGSKPRVKLLHLFLNNPGKAFYVREITRLIDEQINSVRRELANMLGVGIITSQTSDNKLYYEVSQRYEYYVPLRAIFADEKIAALTEPSGGTSDVPAWRDELSQLPGVRIAILSGVFAEGATSAVDILLVGDIRQAQVRKLMKKVESFEGREINYAILDFDDFYYRRSVRDRFVNEIIGGKYITLVDTDTILNATE
jgi:hypothetical protein